MRNEKFSTLGRELNEEVSANTLYRTGRRLTKIAIHSSASPQGRGDDTLTIDRWHMEKWGNDSGCGYHFVILEDGTIEKGRWIDYIGAHVKGFNEHTIGICRIGIDYDTTPQQMKSMLKLTKLLQKQYDIETLDVLGHNEFPYVHKTCPGMDMDKFREILDM